jgi:PAS domain S-box-containing protein
MKRNSVKIAKTRAARQSEAPQSQRSKTAMAGKKTKQTSLNSKLAEKALDEANLRYRRLFETAQEGILIVDSRTGMIEDVNPFVIQMLGFSRKEFVENKLWEQAAFAETEVREASFDARRTNEYFRYEDLALQTKDEQVLHAELVGHAYQVGTKRVVQCNLRNIDERKQVQESLRRSEAFNQNLVEASPIGILYLDKEGVVTYENPAMAKMMGIPKGIVSPVIGKKLLEMPTIKAAMSDYAMYSIRDGKAINSELVHYHSLLGPEVDLEVFSAPMVDAQGRQDGTVVLAQDVTERTRAEDALRKSEERFRNLYENATLGIYSTTPDGRILLANPALVQMLGYSSVEDLARRNLEQEGYEPGYEREQFRRRIEDAGELRGLESAWKRKDGTTIFVRESAKLVRDPEGNILFYEGTVEDITNRKQAEEEQLESRELFNNLIESTFDGLAIHDHGMILEVNSSFCQLFGFATPAEVIGKSALELTAPESRDLLTEKIRTGDDKPYDGIAIHTDGHKIAVELVGRPTRYHGRPARIMAVRDISERKQAQEKIQVQLEHLAAQRDIDQIITSGFDLRFNLTSILRHLTKELGVDAADVLILNTLQILEFSAGYGFRTRAVERAKILLGNSYPGRAALERRLIHVPNLKDKLDYPFLAEFVGSEDFLCYFGVPLIAKGKILGVLEVFHRSRLDPDPDWLSFLETLAGQAALAIDNATLFENLQRSNVELALAYDATIEGWSHALDLRDKETEGHTQRVTQLTVLLAKAFGLNEEESVQVRRGSLLHDIGKMGVPDSILLKPAPLSAEEWVIMKKHPTFAYEMLTPIHYLRSAVDIPYCHHEKWDGTGYPRGLSGEQIPMAARIFAVVDVWDALTSDRPYRKAWSHEKATEYVRAGAGTHFDPRVVQIFLELGLTEQELQVT